MRGSEKGERGRGREGGLERRMRGEREEAKGRERGEESEGWREE